MSKKFMVLISTDKGIVRKVNQDNFVVNQTVRRQGNEPQHLRARAVAEPMLCAVFDGIGGEQGGREASEISALVAAKFFGFLIGINGYAADNIQDYVSSCNSQIKKFLSKYGLKRGGSTFAMAYMHDGIVELFTMGDSRIYLYRSGTLQRITRDHTLAQKKYEANIFTLEEAEKSNESHVLTRYLGMDPDSADYKAESYKQLTLNPNDKLLICSDGLYDMCSDKQIAKILSAKKAPYSINLVKAALKNGGIDNITCLVIEPVLEK